MHRSRWNPALLPLLFGLASVHCGDDDTNAVTVSTGLPSQQKLSTFDDEDARTACDALNKGAAEIISDRELVRSQCASLAIRTSAVVDEEKAQISLDIAKCEKAAAACEAAPATYGITADAGREESDCDAATANQAVMTCDATVAEYEACVSKVLTQAQQTLADIRCDNGRSLLQSDDDDELDPQRFAECKLFLDKCPNVRITASVTE